MAKIYFHVILNSAFPGRRSALQDGGTVDLRTIPGVVGGDERPSATALYWPKGPRQRYGIKTESLFAARTKCPGLTVVPAGFLTGMCRTARR